METALAAVTEENQKLRRENQVLKEENQRLTSEIESAQLLAELKEELKDDFDEKLRTLFDKNQAQKALVKMQKDWDGVQAASLTSDPQHAAEAAPASSQRAPKRRRPARQAGQGIITKI